MTTALVRVEMPKLGCDAHPDRIRKFVDDEDELRSTTAIDTVLSADTSDGDHIVALGCSSADDSLKFLFMSTRSATYVVDCERIGHEVAADVLRAMLTSSAITKVVCDVSTLTDRMKRAFGVAEFAGFFDVELLAERASGMAFLGLEGSMVALDVAAYTPLEPALLELCVNEAALSAKSLSLSDLLTVAARTVAVLLDAGHKFETFGAEALSDAQRATDARVRNVAEYGMRKLFAFAKQVDGSRTRYALCDAELRARASAADVYTPSLLNVTSEVESLLCILPVDVQDALNYETRNGVRVERDLSQLVDVILDEGRRPHCWLDRERTFLCADENRVVSQDELLAIGQGVGGFGVDHRAALRGELHRCSEIIDRNGETTGVTLRVGRYVRGNADMLLDILLGTDLSVLVLGEPGCGKTTIVREATRLLAEQNNVVVVDTSNEIAGDGHVPHECIGLARRMMVSDPEDQSAIMIETVQNHTPHVMVIDEIGRAREVAAARTVKQRGVRMIASAHGDLRSLISNRELNGLVGGSETVTVSDQLARQEAKQRGMRQPDAVRKQKTRQQRQTSPTFECIVEIKRGALHSWKVTTDSAAAVDAILADAPYQCEERTRNSDGSRCRIRRLFR